MAASPRPVAFILASTDHGTMILNRFDQRFITPTEAYGVGFNLLNRSKFDEKEVALVMNLLDLRRQYAGDGVVALDLGANIGVFTIEWARHMTGWGSILAVEAQERIFHALAGNVAINNCFNARPLWAAVAAAPGRILMPVPNYLAPASFGSLQIRAGAAQDLGQTLSYDEEDMAQVPAISVDSLGLTRLDLMKIDVEGMEMEVLEGARQAVGQFHPILVVEAIKTDQKALKEYLETFGYQYFSHGLDTIALHASDPALKHVVRPT